MIARARDRQFRRREAELLAENAALVAMSERLTTLLAYAGDAVVIVSDRGSMLWTSPSFTRLLGWDEPISRLDAPQLVHPADSARAYAAVRDIRENRASTARLDVRLRHRDGRYLLTELVISDHRDDPAIAGLVITFRDVTENRRAVGELTDEVNRYRFLAENASEVLIMASAERVISYASATASVVLERAPSDLIGVSVASLVHADDRAVVDAAMTHAQWTLDVSQVDVRVLRPAGGDHRWVHLVARCVQDHCGEPQYHVSLNDISARRDAESAMAASEQRFRSLAAQTRELVTMIDMRGTITYISPSVEQVLGHDPRAVVGQRVGDYIHPDEYVDLMHRIVDPTSTAAIRHRTIHIDGSYRWLETLAQVLTDPNDGRRSVLLSSRDITDRLQLEHRLDRERGMLAAILDSVHAGVVAVDRNGVILDANQAFCRLLNTPFATGTTMLDYVSTHDLLDEEGRSVPVSERPLEVALAGRSMSDRLFVVVQSSGRRHEMVANATALIDDEGQIDGAVLTYEDVTALRHAQDELRRLATLDPLTGLPNRRRLLVHLAAAMQRHVRSPGRLAVLFVDLDGFKPVNDNLGHDMGDELLRQVAERMMAMARPSDLVARYGGDEFVVVAEDIAGRADALALARRIEHALSQPFELGGTSGMGVTRIATAHIGASAGVTLATNAASIDELLALADQAMYERKKERNEQPAPVG